MLKIFKKIDVTIDEREILRLLANRRRKEKANEAKMSNLIREAKALLADVLHPQGMFRIADKKTLEGEPHFKGQDMIALGIATVGEELENKVGQLSQKGDLARAIILDAMGSVAAESAADSLNLQICEMCKKKGWGSSQRFSPGYGNWPLEGQRFIFSLLPAEKIKVKLNQSCMMIPRKSISFAIKIGEQFKGLEKKRICETCNLKNCPFRK